jgi:multisubunit Na+/H+ antiporter MnhB subunit
MSGVRVRSPDLAKTGLVILAVVAVSLMVPGEAAARRS